MQTTPELSIIFLTFNEEKNIGLILPQTYEVLKRMGITHEFIIVDDASADRTRQEVRKLSKTIPEVRLIERDNERGVATAMVRGYNEGRGIYLGTLDADLAHDPEYLPAMINLLRSGNADFVIGSRYVPGAKFIGKPFLNKIASIVGQLVVRIFLRFPIRDTSNNYRIFHRKVWETIKNRLHPEGNVMLTEIVYRAYQKGFRIVEVPTIYEERRFGKSKLGVGREAYRFFKNILKVKWG
ncbi:MAG: glycosyltransferase [bacterium]|nr:glycosyltransferase [bacterium]